MLSIMKKIIKDEKTKDVTEQQTISSTNDNTKKRLLVTTTQTQGSPKRQKIAMLGSGIPVNGDTLKNKVDSISRTNIELEESESTLSDEDDSGTELVDEIKRFLSHPLQFTNKIDEVR